MTEQNKEFSKIRSALKDHPDGLSITGISEITGMNRNTLGKYLDILKVAGQVRMKSYGMAKVYTLSRRIPLSSVISYCSDLIIILNRDLRIVEANLAAIKILKMNHEEVIGMPAMTLIHNLRLPEESIGWLKTGLKGDNIRTEVTVENKEGDKNYLLRIIPSNFEDNTLGVTLISEDITSRKEAQVALTESEKSFKSLVELIPESMIILSDAEILYINPAGLAMMGISDPDEIIGRNILEYISLAPGDGAERKIREIETHRDKSESEIAITRPDGGLIYARISSVPITYMKDSASLLAMRDITERLRREKRIKDLGNLIHLANSVAHLSAVSESPQEILKEGCELITTSGGYNTAWIVLTGSDDRVIHAAESGLGDLFIPILNAINNGKLPHSLEMACEGPEGEICQDKEDNSLSACLSFRGERLGYLSASLPGGRLPDTREREIFAEAVGVIGLAIYSYNTERKGISSAQKLLRFREITGQILDFIPDAAFATDDEGRVIAWNITMERLTGIRREEITRTEDYALALYGDRDPVLIDLLKTGTDMPTRYSKIWREGDALCGEKLVPGVHGGQGALLRGKALALHDSEGRYLGAIEIIHEIIAGDEGEAAIQKALELISSSEEPIAISDGSGRINLVNRAFLTLWGYSRGEADGRSFVTLWKNEEEAEGALATAIKDGRWKGLLTAQQKTGADFRVQTILKPVYYSDSSVEVVICRFSETEGL